MPKEKIYDDAGMYDAQVLWSKELVQVGIETHDSEPLFTKLGGDGSDPAMFTGVWGSFDRAQINRMIRMLRTARDAAYGKDE